MKKGLNIFAGVLVLVLASASALAQVQSKPQRVNGETKDLPARFLQRTRRVNLQTTPRVSGELEIGETGSLFKDPLPHLAPSTEAASVQTQNASTSWPQWAQNSQHTGFLDVEGQHLDHILADIVYDPLVPDEQAENDGDLLAHFQVPLTEDGDVYMEFKSGTYSIDSYATQTWGENKFKWQGDSLVQAWSFTSDWKAPGSAFDFWEPVFHAVLANGFVYVPGKGGTIFKLNKTTGALVKRINPFNNIKDNRYTASPLSADS
jgi:hypothetical protein